MKSLRSASTFSVLMGFLACGLTSPALAVGNLADVQIVDRDTGQHLPVYRSGERYYVAGRPGSRYAVEVRNRLGERVMSVMSIDGINAVSGETASWTQTGYVWSAYESSHITGWRKSRAQVAAFQFAALENSYAARTGRPDQVGVIGVALFREKMMVPQVQLPPQVITPYVPAQSMRERAESDRADASGAANAIPSAALPAFPATAPSAAKSAAASALVEMESKAPRESAGELASAADRAVPDARLNAKLGTAHGRIETSRISYTDFERRSPAPDEVITIYYDSMPNLIAQGIIPTPIARTTPQPFPGNVGNTGFVPDPPRW